MKKLTKEEIEKIRKIISEDNEEKPMEKEVKILHSKKNNQMSIKIPRDFVEILEINPEKDSFLLKVIFPPSNSKNQNPKLIGELKYGK